MKAQKEKDYNFLLSYISMGMYYILFVNSKHLLLLKKC